MIHLRRWPLPLLAAPWRWCAAAVAAMVWGAVWGAVLTSLVIGGPLIATATLIGAPAAWAAPVQWEELPATADGRQWWDAGSLRRSRNGTLSVLSRYQPAAPEGKADQRPPRGELYVMEIDCDLRLYRDTSVNGLPRFQPPWQAAGDDQLVSSLIDAVCAAGQDRRA